MQGQSLTFTTFAGPRGGAGVDDGTGNAARFSYPTGVATDSSGNVYVAEVGNGTIRKISPAGMVTTLAGLAGSVGSADGTARAARFHPTGVATDSSGNVYVADTFNHTIRKISPGGTVTTLAGLAGREGSADGTGSAAQFSYPNGVATDNGGNVYVADPGNHTIRKISPAGAVTTLAGHAGSSGSEDGAGSARFHSPYGVATDSSGNVYVSDAADNTIRKISPAGAVTTLAGAPGSKGTADGIGAARFNEPRGVAIDSSGNVFVADAGNDTIRKITFAGVVTTLAGLAGKRGSADGTASDAQFLYPFRVATDSGGNVYVADSENHTIRKISPAGTVTTLAGLARERGGADGMGSAARFNSPQGVATDSSGNVYVADTLNHTIRKITSEGMVSTLAGLAGSKGSANGTASAAQFNFPSGVAVDSSGNVYVGDTENHAIRKISPVRSVTTLAGLSGSSGSAEGTGSAAQFSYPSGVATDSSGNVYVADTRNHAIRRISPEGAVTTLAGLAGSRGSDDGTGSAARFNYPLGVATDSAGSIYVVDSYNYTIRKVSAAGAVTTLAGLPERSGTADGTGNWARFTFLFGVAIDSGGNVYVADRDTHRIRVGRAALADVATIDASSGWSRSTRLLDTAPQTATSWQWSVIRRPADSAAILSSESVRNPTFTPDVSGLFTFRLVATGAGAVSITTVDLVSQASPRRRAAGK
jgi:sugar lactone lactonase YvrE